MDGYKLVEETGERITKWSDKLCKNNWAYG